MIPFNSIKETNLFHLQALETTLKRVIKSGQLIMGNELRAFEEEFADYCGAKHCIGVDNGTNALFLSLKVLNIKQGNEVILASNSYLSAALAILHNGLVPIIVEPKLCSYNIDPEKIEAKITSKTKAILITHMYGLSCQMDEIMAIARKHQLTVIDDCAHAHGATYNNKKIGGIADLSAFSFYPTKNLGALGDGGAITTSNPAYANRLLQLRNYGFIRKNEAHIKGYNSRLDELQAAFLRVKLPFLDKSNGARRRIAKRYITGINNPHLILPEYDAGASWHLFVLRTTEREQLKKHLHQHGIDAAVHYPIPFYRQPAFESHHGNLLCTTEHIHSSVLSIPMNENLSDEDADFIIQKLNEFK